MDSNRLVLHAHPIRSDQDSGFPFDLISASFRHRQLFIGDATDETKNGAVYILQFSLQCTPWPWSFLWAFGSRHEPLIHASSSWPLTFSLHIPTGFKFKQQKCLTLMMKTEGLPTLLSRPRAEAFGVTFSSFL